MTALLTADEAARLRIGVNVIVRAGDRREGSLHPMGAYSRSVAQAARNDVTFVAPLDWVALTGPCPTCDGDGVYFDDEGWQIRCATCDKTGRRIVSLYTATCAATWGANHRCCLAPHHDGPHMPVDPPLPISDGVLVGRGSIEVVPVVAMATDHDRTPKHICLAADGVALVGDQFFHKFDPLPVPGRDFGIVIDCVELA